MPNSHHADFIKHLQNLVDNNEGGSVAALKRSLQSEAASQIAAYPYVVPYLPKETRRNDWVYFLVAGLFALHPNHTLELRNLGSTCRRLGTEDDNPTASSVIRFKALLDAEQDEVAHHLRSIISLAASNNVAVNYVQLLEDLCQWSYTSKYVQLNMAREFWRLPEKSTDSSLEKTTV